MCVAVCLQALPAGKPAGSVADNIGWTAGAIYEQSKEYLGSDTRTLVMHTKHGDIHVALLPHLAPKSVAELQRMATLLSMNGRNGHCTNCRCHTSAPQKRCLFYCAPLSRGVD